MSSAVFVHHLGFEVVGLARRQLDGDGFLVGVLVPLGQSGGAEVVGDELFVEAAGIIGNPQRHVVFSADPEGVGICHQWRDRATQTLTAVGRSDSGDLGIGGGTGGIGGTRRDAFLLEDDDRVALGQVIPGFNRKAGLGGETNR